jgi:molecular chaperone GrpE
MSKKRGSNQENENKSVDMAQQESSENIDSTPQQQEQTINGEELYINEDDFDANRELEECQEELANYKDKYLRAVADFDNSKRRLEREKSDAVAFANENFAKDILTILDTFEQALNSIDKIEEINEDSIEKIKEGINLTYNQFINILKKHGVEEVITEGEFDPNFHQVVIQEDSENHKTGEIVRVLQKGYMLKDRLLRPAMVSSCK